MVHKTCAECGAPIGDVHGNTKYCERCKIKRIRESKRKYEQKRRTRIRPQVLSDPHGNKFHVATTENLLLMLRNQEEQIKTSQRQLIQDFNQAFYQTFKEFSDKVSTVELKLDEFMYFLRLNPETLQKYQWTQRAITEACKILQDFGEILPLYRIRQILQQMLKIDKQTAENILKQANERLRWLGDRGQKRLDEFEQEED